MRLSHEFARHVSNLQLASAISEWQRAHGKRHGATTLPTAPRWFVRYCERALNALAAREGCGAEELPTRYPGRDGNGVTDFAWSLANHVTGDGGGDGRDLPDLIGFHCPNAAAGPRSAQLDYVVGTLPLRAARAMLVRLVRDGETALSIAHTMQFWWFDVDVTGIAMPAHLMQRADRPGRLISNGLPRWAPYSTTPNPYTGPRS